MSHIYTFHGLGSSKNAFSALKPALETDHTVHLYDFPGFGNRINDPIGKDPIQDEIGVLYDQMSHRDDLVIIVHSMGSAVGLPLALALGNKVQAVINIEGNLIGKDCGYLSRGVLKHANEGSLSAFRKEMIERLESSPYPGWRGWARDFAKVKYETLKPYAKSLVTRSDSGELLQIFHSLTCKKRYLYGNEYRDEQHPVLDQIKGVRKVHLDTGHFVMTDDPEGCGALIKELLDQ